METVRVDIEKLQLLNDRIAQTIDALNQVRMTTHGLQHSSAQFAGTQGYVPSMGQQAAGLGWYPGSQFGPGAAGISHFGAGQGMGVPSYAGRPQVGAGIPQMGAAPLLGQGFQQAGAQPYAGSWVPQVGAPIGPQLMQSFPQQVQGLPQQMQGLAHASVPQAQLGHFPVPSQVPFSTQVPQSQSPWTLGLGIRHSSRGLDPIWQSRVAQTFPFAQYPNMAFMAV